MTEIYLLLFLSFLSHSVSLPLCVCVLTCVHAEMHVEDREQFLGVRSSGLVAGTFTHYLQP